MRIRDFIQPGKASVIVGGQFGSEAKGMAAAVVASHIPHNFIKTVEGGAPSSWWGKHMVCTTNAGAQAGHTTVLDEGKKFVCYHLPTIGVLCPWSTIYLNAGSIIDLTLLNDEVNNVAQITGEPLHQLRRRILIHPNAAIITKEAREREAKGATAHLGSTMKGVGAAQAAKIMRNPNAVAGYDIWHDTIKGMGMTVCSINLNKAMAKDNIVTVEIPQGTGLSINAASFYPKCTSRDCWVGQGFTDAGIHPSFLGPVMMVTRTFPIRVGHIYDDAGMLIGHSGPFYSDSQELDWEVDFPGLVPERTTVTKRVRRIATWSEGQYEDAIRLNRPDIVMHTFTNYFKDVDAFNDYAARVDGVHDVVGINPTSMWSWGPGIEDWSNKIDDAVKRL